MSEALPSHSRENLVSLEQETFEALREQLTPSSNREDVRRLVFSYLLENKHMMPADNVETITDMIMNRVGNDEPYRGPHSK